jgi:leucyl aminopeptidase
MKITTTSTLKTTTGDHGIILFSGKNRKKLKALLKTQLQSWQLKKLDENSDIKYFDGKRGPLAVITIEDQKADSNPGHYQILTPSNFGQSRDLIGQAIARFGLKKIKSLKLHGFGIDEEIWGGAMVGLEMSQYHFHKKFKFNCQLFNLEKDNPAPKSLKKYIYLGHGTNLSRYLVDVPPGNKRPMDYAKFLQTIFSGNPECKLTIWDEKKLAKEKMGMMLAVGGASAQAPRLVHLKYRSTKAKGKKPFAFVGKGITFDSGGLDIKPASGMRWMKKDMGGSATLAGVAHWVVSQKLPVNCDFYFAMAENAVDAHSFRPGDVLESRKGLKVEIDNTDAEGRLVLGDALTVASEDNPAFVIDVATLTGAIKVALGAETGGLFSNDDKLADQLLSHATRAGEQVWRMPLLKEQRRKLTSPVADLANSSGGFGGAVRAAMFLKEFIGKIPWAHFDIYSWVDSPQGPYLQKGGNGQLVQTLSMMVEGLSAD